jgi:hypothetical protein
MLPLMVKSASLSWCQAILWGTRPAFYYCQTVGGLLIWGALSDERMGLSFAIAAGSRQCSHSWVQVLQDLWPYFTVLDLRLLQPGGPGPRICIPQEKGGSVIPPDTGFLWLAGLRWRYLNLPPCVSTLNCPAYNILAWTAQKTLFLCCCLIVATETCLFVKLLLRNDCFMFAYLAVVAQQWVYMPQYVLRCLVSLTCLLVVNVFFNTFYVQTFDLRFSDFLLR